MATKMMDQRDGPKSTQARGRARRAQLLEASRDLLNDARLDQIGMVAVAERAGIPASSAYHLFDDVGELWRDLARTIATVR